MKTTSYRVSNLSQPAISLNGRPPSSLEVNWAAAISGGTMNGRRSTGSMSAANRVRPTIALKNVPTAEHPPQEALDPDYDPRVEWLGEAKEPGAKP